MASDTDNQTPFHDELKTYEILLPGNQKIQFTDSEVLLELVEKQYPGWKNGGQVASVPIARVPRLLLQGSQLEKQLEKDFSKVNEKGDKAERRLYKLFIDGGFTDKEYGFLVFPNFDSSRIFKTQVAKVEIDMILVHARKGIFIFNVKNIGGKKWKGSKLSLEEHIQKHKKFIRMLIESELTLNGESIPVHTVLCDCAKANSKTFNSKIEKMKEEEGICEDKYVVLSKNDIDSEHFSEVWQKKLEDAEIGDITWNPGMDLIVARLIALASIEGSSALIHKKMLKGFLQAVAQEHFETQIGDLKMTSDPKSKEYIVQHSQVAKIENDKNLFILWTKDQIKVISTVYEHLVLKPEEGLRLLVSGGKGSGKTMLLIFLAKFAQSLLEYQSGECAKNKILVCEGSFQSIGLLHMFRETFQNTNVEVFDSSALVNQSIGASDENVESIRDSLLGSRSNRNFDDLTQQLQHVFVVFCDETLPQNQAFFGKHLRSDQHLVMFSSLKTEEQPPVGTSVSHLSSCLRSTCEIARFANSYIENGPKNILPALPTSNLLGEPVQIHFVQPDPTTEVAEGNFVEKCESSIIAECEKCTGLDYCLVVPLMEPKISKMIIANLRNKGYICITDSSIFTSNSDDEETRTNISNYCLPRILFCNPVKVEGCEFATVLILMDAKNLEVFSFTEHGNSLTTAITRASLKVVIIINDYGESSDDHLNNYLIQTHEEDLRNYVESCPDGDATVLFVGKKPKLDNLTKLENPPENSIPSIDGISLYVGQNIKFFHIDDVFRRSDLETLQASDVKTIVITNECVSNLWLWFFYRATASCVSAFFHQNMGSANFRILGFFFTNKLMRYQIDLNLRFFRQQQSGDFTVKVPIFDLDVENEPILALPQMDWKLWRAKADELLKLKVIAPAVSVYEICHQLLQKQLSGEKDAHCDVLSNEMMAVSTILSRSYLEHADDIVRGSKIAYWINEHTPQDCLVKAFKHVTNAIKWNFQLQEGYEIFEAILLKLKDFCSPSTARPDLVKLIKDDKNRKAVSRYRLKPRYSLSWTSSNFENEVHDLDTIISIYETKRFTGKQAELFSLRRTMSSKATKIAQHYLDLMSSESDPESIRGKAGIMEDSQLMFQKTVQVFDYAVQLALEAFHWDPSSSGAAQVLLSSVELLETRYETFKKCLGKTGTDSKE